MLSLGLLLAIPVLWAHEVRQHRERADAERDRVERERRLAELDRAAAVAAERNRMARDLHDVIAGQLSAIAIQSEAALSVDADPETLRHVLADVRRGSVASLAEMRTMIGLLRADDPDEPRTAPAGLDRIGALLDAGRATGLSVALEDRRPAGAGVPAAVDLAAYRIVQESLTNAAKHAPGSAVLRHEDGKLRVEIDNELVRDAPAGGGTGTGLLGLAERAAAVGGSVQARPRGRSWTVRAALPTSPASCGPDLVLMDIRMPGIDGIGATRRIVADRLCEVLVLTTFDLDDLVHGALAAGAAGSLLKSVAVPQLLDAVHSVARGDGVLAPGITRRVLARLAGPVHRPAPPAGIADLTPRETHVLGCLGRGQPNAEIAATLVITETTTTHVSRVLAKLAVLSRVQAAIVAQDAGLA